MEVPAQCLGRGTHSHCGLLANSPSSDPPPLPLTPLSWARRKEPGSLGPAPSPLWFLPWFTTETRRVLDNPRWLQGWRGWGDGRVHARWGHLRGQRRPPGSSSVHPTPGLGLGHLLQEVLLLQQQRRARCNQAGSTTDTEAGRRGLPGPPTWHGSVVLCAGRASGLPGTAELPHGGHSLSGTVAGLCVWGTHDSRPPC